MSFNSTLFTMLDIKSDKTNNDVYSERKNPLPSSNHPYNAKDYKYFKELTLDHMKVSGTENGKRTICRDLTGFILRRFLIRSDSTPRALSRKTQGNYPLGAIHAAIDRSVQRWREVRAAAFRSCPGAKNGNDCLSL